MKKIGLFLFAAVMSLLAVSCRDVLLEKNIGGFSVSFQTPGSSSRAGATATWKLEAWLELEGGAQLQKKNDTVPANAPITISFDAVPIGTKLKVQVRLEDNENQFIQHEGSSDWITVDAESKTVVVQVQRMIINAAAPTITTQPESQNRRPEAGSDATWTATLTVVATSPDGGNLSYKWYENTANSNSGGTLIPEATKVNYQVGLIPGETKYFYCEVTNTNDGVNGSPTATTISNVAKLVYDIAQSGVLLWKRTDDGSSFGGSIVPYGDYDVPGTVLPGDLSQTVSWCFDNTGNLYWYAKGENGAQCYNLQSDKSYSPSGVYYYSSSLPFSALSYDNVESILYGISDTQILKLETSGSNQIIDFSNNVITPIGFAVHNGIAYVANKSSEDDNGIPSITIVSFDLTTKSFTSGTEFKLPTVFGGQPTCQMIYQEGALYLMVSGVKDSSPTLVSSVGAVVKIDPTTLRLDERFGTDGYLGLSTERKVPYQDWSGADKLCSVYAASSPTEQVFSRPQSFVAIMPKKLVIADAGCIVYDEIVNQGGVPKLKGKAVSRIVTVDLENQSLGFEDLDPNQYYWTGNPLGSSVDIPSDTSSSFF